jgi:cytochrome c biogenesis protein CcdA
VGRLLTAHALRLIVVLCVGLSIVFSSLTVVGLALGDVAHPWYIAAVAAGVVAVLLSIARLAHLMLARLVNLGPTAKSRSWP